MSRTRWMGKEGRGGASCPQFDPSSRGIPLSASKHLGVGEEAQISWRVLGLLPLSASLLVSPLPSGSLRSGLCAPTPAKAPATLSLPVQQSLLVIVLLDTSDTSRLSLHLQLSAPFGF